MNLFSKNSLIRKLLTPMLFVIALQLVLFVCAVKFGGTFQYLQDTSFKMFENQIINRVKVLQNAMLLDWSNINDYTEIISADMMKGGEVPEINAAVCSDLIYLMRRNNVTGSFAIIMSPNPQENQAFYIRDLDPIFNSPDNSDILVEIGSADIIKKAGLTMDSNWTLKFNLNDTTDSSFLYKPINAARDAAVKFTKDSGYWSLPFKIHKNDIDVITYTVPLVNKDGEPYGVLGVEITLNHVRSFLPYAELDSSMKGAYVLAVNNMPNTYNPIVHSGPSYMEFSAIGKSLNFKSSSVRDNIYMLNNSKNNAEIYGVIMPLQLYSADSAFSDQRWELIGMLDEENLFRFTETVIYSLLLTLMLTSIIGVIGVITAGYGISYPVAQLAESVKSYSRNKPLKLKKINIDEIDDLSDAIESLNENIMLYSLKLSKILELSEVNIAAFEYGKSSYRVFVTENLFKLMDIDSKPDFDGYISRFYFETIFADLLSELSQGMDRIIMRSGKNNGNRWLRLKTVNNNGNVLGIMLDATNEIIEKRKIEYERDHDSMTHLYNKGAFNSIIENKLNSSKVTLGMLIMCDLDNLKHTNDKYGHDIGDRYIKAFADRLLFFEKYGATVARISGDEFMVFIDGFQTKREYRAIVSEFYEYIKREKVEIEDRTMSLKASFGTAWYPLDSSSFKQLQKFADFAMYEIKNTVKNNIKEFDPESYRKSKELLRKQEDFELLMSQKQIDFAFQPIIDLKTGSVYGYEALMRPYASCFNGPDEVLDLGALLHQLDAIEYLTIVRALNQYMDKAASFGGGKVFINSLSGQMLPNNELDYLETVFAEPMSNMVLEIINSTNSDRVTNAKKRIWTNDWNCMLAYDNFIISEQSYNLLSDPKPDIVKIDKSFISDIDKNIIKRNALKKFTSFASEYKILTVAVGIETKEELEAVMKAGVDLAQGFYFGKPELVIEPISSEIVNQIHELNRQNRSKFI